MRGRAVLVIAGIAALVAAPSARAATYTVTGTTDGAGDCSETACTTLRAAITAANATTQADTIELGAATYTLHGELPVSTDITVAGARADTTAVAEDLESGRVFVIGTGGKLTVQHATLGNGFTPGNGGDVLATAGAQLILDHARVTGGSASTAGGIFVGAGASARISHSLIDGNRATGDGGAIVAVGTARLAPVGITLSITDSTVTGNTASSSAGIVVRGDARNVTSLTRSTIAANTASTTGGAAGVFIADAEGFTVTGSIISGNTGDGVPLNCGGTLTSGGGNVDSGSSCGLTMSSDRQNTDPGLGALTASGGETPVLPITALSPAVDLTPIEAAACIGTDQRDLRRPQGGGCDAGAYELEQAPDTSITSGPSGTIATASATFGFSSTEPGATFECTLDGPGDATGDFAGCTSTKTYEELADGTYTFSVRAEDETGNTDASPASRTFVVDTTPPDTIIAAGPSGPTNDSSPSLSFDSTEPAATFGCKLAGPGTTMETFSDCSSPKTYPNLSDGSYTLFVRATDAAGNTDPTPATRSFTVDTTAPGTTITGGPRRLTDDDSPSFSFGSTEGGSTFECALDGPGAATGPFAPCTSPKAYAGLADGSYTFRTRATDPAGNVAGSATRSFTVDTSPPRASILSGPTGATADRSPSFAFSSGESGATLECRLDGPSGAVHAFAPCSSPRSFAALASGAYTFFVRARDAAGNETVASRSFTVEPAAAPPPSPPSGPEPQPRSSVVVTPLNGRVLIKLPGTSRFVPLDVTTGIPLGSTVDTLRGRVGLSAIREAGNQVEAARFSGGVFRVTQTAAVTQLRLVQRLSCSVRPKKASDARGRVTKRRLWGNGKGRFRTRGRYSSATVRGTKWLVRDSCDKTLTRVARGVVVVRDFARHRIVSVRAGHSYTARKR